MSYQFILYYQSLTNYGYSTVFNSNLYFSLQKMSETESDFEPQKSSKKESKSASKDKASKASLSKPKKEKGKVDKKEKGGKANPKQPKKKKESKVKDGIGDSESKQVVLDYMQKQNRPYNLLNVFDNLHGKIKKPLLQSILNELTEESKLTCKQFGKNKVYFINQESLNVDKQNVDKLGMQYSQLRTTEVDLSEMYKKALDELRKLMSRKTLNEIKEDISVKQKIIGELQIKRDKLMDIGSEKIDEKEVELIEKEEGLLSKQLKKRRRLVKDCLGTWGEILQKKTAEVAEIMGIDL